MIKDRELLNQFFHYLYEGADGYLCICIQPPGQKDKFQQRFFNWPEQENLLLDYVEQKSAHNNVWFCINLLTVPERSKQFCKSHNLVWSDADTANPQEFIPKPQCIIESSPSRYQAIWRLDQTVDPYLAEQYSKKIAYKYSSNGADKSGWDLGQLLRVPLTKNLKYLNAPEVVIRQASMTLCPTELFDELEVEVDNVDDPLSDPIPTEYPNAINVIYKYQHGLSKTAFPQLYDSEPPDNADWSSLMWRLVNICFEVGMDKEEVYAVALDAKCNKYKRDGRSPYYLWREILKAFNQQRRLEVLTEEYKPLVMPILANEDELSLLADDPTFIDIYRNWASESTDAVVDFHNLAAFMLLSFFISGSVRLETSHGKYTPNLWGLILGDSTLTRKSTAMQMAMNFVYELDSDLVLASEGSVEGILTGLSLRPERVSIFYKDEVTGFIESMQKKDYMAGMRETFTQLYDVPTVYNRMLRKEVIQIQKPVFIIFGGGIREKMHHLVTEEFITSGFMPRFLIVSGETDLQRLKKTGPPTAYLANERERIRNKIADIYEIYGKSERPVEIAGKVVMMPSTIGVKLADSAWEKYGQIEEAMTKAAFDTTFQLVASPSFHRLKDSMLKMAILLAAARQEPNAENFITVERRDILQAAKYVQHWGNYTVDLILNYGRSTVQRTIDRVKGYVERRPGISRGDVSKSMSLTKREMDEILNTLVDRGEIRLETSGRAVKLWRM